MLQSYENCTLVYTYQQQRYGLIKSLERVQENAIMTFLFGNFIGRLHNPANFQQTFSISTCILNTFAGSLMDRVNTPLV